MKTPDVTCAASSWPSSARSSDVSTRVSGGAISTSVPRTPLVALAAAAIIWFIASPTADSSSSVRSSASSSGGSSPIIAAASARAPFSGMTKTLPPVTPSTYETLAVTAGVGRV